VKCLCIVFCDDADDDADDENGKDDVSCHVAGCRCNKCDIGYAGCSAVITVTVTTLMMVIMMTDADVMQYRIEGTVSVDLTSGTM